MVRAASWQLLLIYIIINLGRKKFMSSLLDMDPNILVSMVNMKLRDFYSNLDQYCEDVDINKDELINKLSKVGYEYNIELNQFK